MAEELRVARARLAEARSNIDLARSTMERNEGLASQGAASRQEAENARARYHSARAAVGTGAAEARRLETLLHYQRVTAPFAGTVVRRWVDAGAFAQSGSTRLVEVAGTETLEPGAVVVTGVVLRTAGALDPQTRTLRVKIRVPGDGGLVPGSYVRVRLEGATSRRPVRIPANALVVDKEGTSVATVERGLAVRRPISIVRDLGKELEVEGDIAAGSTVVLSPPVDLAYGERVKTLDRSGGPPTARR